MNHYSQEEWIDFVNELVPARKKQEMERHLDEGCKRCSKMLSVWQRVQHAARNERNYQPSNALVGMAKASFEGSLLAEGRERAYSLAELLFDSALQPVFAGARSSGTAARQMLYRADPFQIDLHLEIQPGGTSIVVTGQLLDVSHPDLVGGNVPVMISNLRGGIVRTITNQFGEFRETIETSGDLELIFHGGNKKQVVITVRDALGPPDEGKS
jgi:hypothetical protein